MYKNVQNILLGNCLDYACSALYGFAGYKITKYFFGDITPTNLITVYAGLIISFFIKPVAILFFNFLMKTGRVSLGLRFSLIGCGIVTCLMYFLPPTQMGFIMLNILRLLQVFFCYGEAVLMNLYVFKIIDSKYRASYAYSISITIGVWLGSFIANHFDWRIGCLILGSAIFLVGCYRFANVDNIYNTSDDIAINDPEDIHNIDNTDKDNESKSTFNLIRNTYKKRLYQWFQIITFTNLDQITYYLPMVLLNLLVPIVNSNITHKELFVHNDILLLIDSLGFILSYRMSKGGSQYLNAGSILLGYGLISLIFLTYLGNLSLTHLILLRVALIILGVHYAILIQVFMYQNFMKNYLEFNFCKLIGKDFVGKSMVAVCLSILHWVGGTFYVGLYIFTWCLIGAIFFYSTNKAKAGQQTIKDLTV